MPRTNSDSHQWVCVPCPSLPARSHFYINNGRLRLIFAMERASGRRTEHLGSTALHIQEEADWIMERIETYFLVLGASVQRSSQLALKAEVKHPDGFAVCVSAQCCAGVDHTDCKTVDVLRCSGDAMLFHMVYNQFLAYDFGRGTWPKNFYDGQLCPRVIMKAVPPSLEPPVFTLVPGGVKRKLADDST